MLDMLPVESAESILRAVLSFTSSAIVSLFVADDGVPEYNLYALFRLHADVGGLARLAASFRQIPGLEVRCLCFASARLPCCVEPASLEVDWQGLCRRGGLLTQRGCVLCVTG